MEFDYEHLINMGFERIEMSDPVFERQHGYPCFYLEKHLTKRIQLMWLSDERTLELSNSDKKGYILSKYTIENNKELVKIIAFFETKDGSLINPEKTQGYGFSHIA